MAQVELVLTLYRERYFDFNVRHFHGMSDRNMRRYRNRLGVTQLALTPEGTTFWAAGAWQDKFYLRNFDPANPVHDPPSIPFGNPEAQSLHLPYDVTEMIVIGEWRAGLPEPRSRGRAVRR